MIKILMSDITVRKLPFFVEKSAEMQGNIENEEGCNDTFKIIKILEEFMQNNA